MDETRGGAFTRRYFLWSGAAALALPACGRAAIPYDATPQPMALASGFPQMPTGGEGVTPCGSFRPPSVIPHVGRIAPASEPGQPIEIEGVVWRGDRQTLASDIVIFAYHTDTHGLYNHPNSPFNPRLYGWIRTDAQGRYKFRTIKPAPYPQLDTPAHIHVSLFGPGIPEYWVDDYWFAGDPLITPSQRSHLTGRGGGGETLHLVRGSDGVSRARRDFVLQHVRVNGGCRLLKA
jgi:protocatechuate 3,4-dioxygenase, beta subunit